MNNPRFIFTENCSDRLEIKDSIKISKSKLILTLIDLGYILIKKLIKK